MDLDTLASLDQVVNIPEHIFRAYDVRGDAERDLTPELMYQIGRALGTWIDELGDKRMVVGRDGRLSSSALLAALKRGLFDSGAQIFDIGLIPTPLLSFALQHLKVPHGAIVTGSHNPKTDNGLKFTLNGKPCYQPDIKRLLDRVKAQYWQDEAGSVESLPGLFRAYTQAITSHIELARPLKVVIDAGNSVVGLFAPALFEALGCEVIPLYCEVDGHFPHHPPDPAQPRHLQDLAQLVLQHQADLGLGFDGDGDRLGVIDEQGNFVYADHLLMLYAQRLLQTKPGETIIFDVKCSHLVPRYIEAQGGHACMWKTGHSVIKAKMVEIGACLAGEMSGHFFFKDRWYGFDDALYAAVRLSEIVAAETRPLSTCLRHIPYSDATPELIIPVSETDKFALVAALAERAEFEGGCVTLMDGVRVDFKEGFGLVRASNTQAALSARFAAQDTLALQQIQGRFRKALMAVRANLAIPF